MPMSYLGSHMISTRHVKYIDINRLKVKGWRNIYYAYINLKKSCMAVLIQDEIDFRAKKINRDKVGFYIMIKELIHKEDKKSNVDSLNIRGKIDRTRRRNRQTHN